LIFFDFLQGEEQVRLSPTGQIGQRVKDLGDLPRDYPRIRGAGCAQLRQNLFPGIQKMLKMTVFFP
jgi:hypothetical protein